MILQAISGLSDRMHELRGMSASQSNTLSDMSEQFQASIGQPATANNVCQNHEASTHTFIRSVGNLASDIEDDIEHQDAAEDLSKSIKRLCQLAEETPRTVHSVEAQSIIDDLEVLLDAVSKTSAPLNAKAQPIIDRKRRLNDVGNSGQEVECRRDLKRVRGLLTSSTAVEINRTGLSCTTSA